MVSVTEKAHKMCQVGTEKANVSEPLMKCRKRSDDIKTGVQLLPRDEPGGYLSTALAVVRHGGGASSVWALARNVGTPRCDDAGRCVDADGGRENPKQLICEGESTDARQGDGPPRSSGEGPVIGLE